MWSLLVQLFMNEWLNYNGDLWIMESKKFIFLIRICLFISLFILLKLITWCLCKFSLESRRNICFTECLFFQIELHKTQDAIIFVKILYWCWKFSTTSILSWFWVSFYSKNLILYYLVFILLIIFHFNTLSE